MKVRAYCDCTEITGHHPGEECCKSESYELELPDGLDEKALNKAIEDSMPRGGPLVSYAFDRYEIIE